VHETDTDKANGAGERDSTPNAERHIPSGRTAKSWTPDWIAAVEAKEESLERPICGARLMSGNPCTLVSTHPSGRCRYHGGFDLTGAPEGNRNAVLHNLYSRRLMPCGTHCPVWQSCPLGGGAKDQGASIIKLDPADRPTCPYEQTEYNTAVSDALQSVPDRRTLAYARHIVHQLALAQVMVTRSGLALREAEFTKVTVITGEKYHMTTPKVAPALAAYEKLERAWRRLLMHFDRTYVNYSDRPIEDAAYTRRSQSDTPLDPDTQTQHYQSMVPLDLKKFYRDIAEKEEAARSAASESHVNTPGPLGVESKEERNAAEEVSPAISEDLARAP